MSVNFMTKVLMATLRLSCPPLEDIGGINVNSIDKLGSKGLEPEAFIKSF